MQLTAPQAKALKELATYDTFLSARQNTRLALEKKGLIKRDWSQSGLDALGSIQRQSFAPIEEYREALSQCEWVLTDIGRQVTQQP